MKKQTAVEWLIQWSKENPIAFQSDYYAAIEQAKAMEKEQIMEAYDSGLFDGSMDIVKDRMYKKYYNETYGGDK